MLLLCSFGYGLPSEAGGKPSKPSDPPETKPPSKPKELWKLKDEAFDSYEAAQAYASDRKIDPKEIISPKNENKGTGGGSKGTMVRWGLAMAAFAGLCYVGKYCYYYFYPPEEAGEKPSSEEGEPEREEKNPLKTGSKGSGSEKEEPNQKEKKKTPLKTESGESNTGPKEPLSNSDGGGDSGELNKNTHPPIGEPPKGSGSGGEGSNTGPEKPPKEEKYTPLSIEPESKAKDYTLLKILFVLLLLVLAGGGIYWARQRR